MIKKVLILIPMFCLLFIFSAHAAETSSQSDSLTDYYKEQMELSGANTLSDELPNETRTMLEKMGIAEPDWQTLSSLTPNVIFSQIWSTAQEQSKNPLKAMMQVMAVMLLCALIEGMKLSFGEKPLAGVLGVISTLCICAIIVTPVVSCISTAAAVIKGAAGFMMAYIPVMTGIMIAGGQSLSAAAYHILMVGAGEAMTQVASRLLVPLLNIFLALSVTASVSPRLNLTGICDMFSKVIKWILGFIMSVFVGLLAIQSIIGTAADTAGTKAVKFVISSFVPIVGGALSDALNTVQSCVKLLKSGVGAFGIIAAGCVFIPILIQCLLWLAALQVCAAVGDVFELKQTTSLLRASGKVISTIISILLCCMTVLIVSTVLMLMIGGATG